jgi:hypothetical protein
MSERMKPILAALVTGMVVNYLGLTYFFGRPRRVTHPRTRWCPPQPLYS